MCLCGVKTVLGVYNGCRGFPVVFFNRRIRCLLQIWIFKRIYGTIWDCALINKENAEQLEKLSVVEWLKLVLKSETKIFHLHPDTIDAAKNIVQATSSRCGPISDNGFYGR